MRISFIVGVFNAFPFFGLLYLIMAMPSSVSIATCWSLGGVDVDVDIFADVTKRNVGCRNTKAVALGNRDLDRRICRRIMILSLSLSLYVGRYVSW